MMTAPTRLHRANYRSWSFQQWHPRSHDFYCLSTSYVYEEEWWQHTSLSESNTDRKRLSVSSPNLDTNFWLGIHWTWCHQ